MKKIVFLLAIFSFLALSGFAPRILGGARGIVLAQTVPGEEEELGIGTSGILPTNPFYFLKEWRRGFRRLITRNPVRRAELELDILNQRAAEINQLQELTPDNTEAINNAITLYEGNMLRLREYLLEITETSQNPNVDKLLDALTERSLRHEELFLSLQEKFAEHDALKENLRYAQGIVTEVVNEIPGRLEIPEKFKARLERITEGELPLRFQLMFATSTATSTLEATSTPEVAPAVMPAPKKEVPVKVAPPKKTEAPKVIVEPPKSVPAEEVVVTPPSVPVKSFVIEADDAGLHPAWITVKKGDRVRITFRVLVENTHYEGFEFRTEMGLGWDTTGRIYPGTEKAVEFIADKNFNFTNYLGASGYPRATGSVSVEE